MSPVTKFVLAMVKGMGGPDLEKAIEDTVSWAGEEVGKLMREVAKGTPSESKKKSEEKLVAYLESHQEQATGIFASLIAGIDSTSTSSDFTLQGFLQVLNIVCSMAERVNGSLVLQGFVHSDKCLSYWHRKEKNESPGFQPFYKMSGGMSVIRPPSNMEIYILPESTGTVASLNGAIRRNENRELSFQSYFRCPKVWEIRETEIVFAGGENDDAEIPDGAPALLSLAKSIPLAISSYQAPAVALAQTLQSISKLGNSAL